MFARGLALVSLVTIALGKPMARIMKVHERREVVPQGFTLRAPAPPDTTLSLRLALAQTDSAELERRVMDVSTPSSPNYRQHLSKEEVEELVAPKQESVDMVYAWLAEHDITPKTISPAGDWLAFDVPVSKANELFDAEFSVFEQEDSDMDAIRTLSYSIPAELKGHLDLVHPTVSFPASESGRLPLFSTPLKDNSESPEAQNLTSRAVPSACADSLTPACLQALYNLPTTKATQSSSKIAVTGFLQSYASQADLTAFLNLYRKDMSSSTTFSLETIDGGQNPQGSGQAGAEANVDIQYTVGLATGVPTVFISVGSQVQDGALSGMLDVVNYLLAQDSPPTVLTTSYGADEERISRDLAIKLCNGYAQLAARGVSVLFSSGDGGVSGVGKRTCTNGNFVPTWPSGCPYITSVGGTRGVSPEAGADFSAGGFSNYFQRPVYQVGSVTDYISGLGSTYSGKYNASGRGFPDVAMQSWQYEIIVNGANKAVFGTSAASPAFAATIALLNDRLAAAGQSPLGFLNPLLYSTRGAAAFNDITTGSNPGCDTDGFSATVGWDPVTGLGTPDFNKLLTLFGL
ncbi:family S53 protease [Daedaleopsis nitida]|nr:family S53 protease [Daedaleopsis nitida]